MQQRLLILRQPGNGADRGQRKKEGEVERREERREKRQAPMWSTPYSESSPRHFLCPTNNTIILNITIDKPTAEARDPTVPFRTTTVLGFSNWENTCAYLGITSYPARRPIPPTRALPSQSPPNALPPQEFLHMGVGVKKPCRPSCIVIGELDFAEMSFSPCGTIQPGAKPTHIQF